MGRQKGEYEIIVLSAETDEEKNFLKSQICKFYCNFIIKYLLKSGVDYNQAETLYKDIITKMINNK
jgi:hypothetical protein